MDKVIKQIQGLNLNTKKINIDVFWKKITTTNITSLENKIKYLLSEYGTSLRCNRFCIGYAIENILSEHIKSSGLKIAQFQNAQRVDICIENTLPLSIKYSSTGDITLHNSNGCINSDVSFTDLILLTPSALYLITQESLLEEQIDIHPYLKNTGDSLKLRRKFLSLVNKSKYKLDIDIKVDKKKCKNRSASDVFYKKVMEDYDKLLKQGLSQD